jgi:hypothetical protein
VLKTRVQSESKTTLNVEQIMARLAAARRAYDEALVQAYVPYADLLPFDIAVQEARRADEAAAEALQMDVEALESNLMDEGVMVIFVL